MRIKLRESIGAIPFMPDEENHSSSTARRPDLLNVFAENARSSRASPFLLRVKTSLPIRLSQLRHEET